MEEKEYVLIEKDEYKSLLRDSYILAALEIGGVDNWSFYGEAINEYLREMKAENFDDIVSSYLVK